MKKITAFIFASFLCVMFASASAPATGLQFSGIATSVIAINSQAAFSPTEFTIEVWANFQTLNGGGYIISTEGWNPTNHGFSLRLNGNKLNFSIGSGTNWPGISSSADITPNSWFHIAVTCTATDLKMYINGVQDATTTLTAPMGVSTEKITLGDSPAWPGRRFIGQIADLRFWNVVRTQAEITADMTSVVAASEAALVAGWKMNEGAGSTVADIKATYNLTKPADVAWFGVTTAVKPVADNSTNIESLISGRTIEVSNKTTGKMQLSVYNITGQKLMEYSVNANNKFQKQLTNISGSYVLKCVAENGATYTRRFILK